MRTEVNLGDIVDITYGTYVQPAPFNGKTRILRITDILPYSRLVKEAVSPYKLESRLLQKNEILLPRTGTVFFPYLYHPETGPAVCAESLFRMKVQFKMRPEFIYYQLCSRRFRDWIDFCKRDRNISREALKKYPLIMKSQIEIQVIHMSELSIKVQYRTIDLIMEKWKRKVRKYMMSEAEKKLKDYCTRCPGTASNGNGRTPVIGIEGICGYTDKEGVNETAVAVQRTGKSYVYIIPKGCLVNNQLLCFKPKTISLRNLYRFLKVASDTSDCRLPGTTAHLKAEMLLNQPCKLPFEEEEKELSILEKQLLITKKMLQQSISRHEFYLQSAFPNKNI